MKLNRQRLAELFLEQARIAAAIAAELALEDSRPAPRRSGKRGQLKPRPNGDGKISDIARERARRILGE